MLIAHCELHIANCTLQRTEGGKADAWGDGGYNERRAPLGGPAGRAAF